MVDKLDLEKETNVVRGREALNPNEGK